MNILVIRTSSLGDVVMTTPAFAALKAEYPECKITYLVDDRFSGMVKNHPFIDRVIPIRWLDNEKKPFQLLKEIKKTLRLIKLEKYDLAFDFQGLLRSVVFLWLSGAKKKYGRGNWIFLSGKKPHNRKLPKHNVFQNQEILSLAGINVKKNYGQNISGCIQEINPGEWADTHLQSFDKIIAVNPWTAWPSKSVPALLLAGACNEIGDKIRSHFFVLGAKSEMKYALEVFKLIRHPKSLLTGKLGLGELAGFLKKSSLLITGDTGPMHIASALATPQVAVFGPTHPLRTGPYEGKFEIISTDLNCMPCFKRECPLGHRDCINSLETWHISEKAIKLLT